MRSTYMVSKIYRVLGIVFLISDFFVFLGTAGLVNDVMVKYLLRNTLKEETISLYE